MTVPLADLVADATHFRAWLESLPPVEVVGHRGQCSDCPLANFCRVYLDKNVTVSEDRIIVWNAAVDLSAVLKRFVQFVDRPRTGRLTATKCLALLARAEREVGG